MTADRHILAVSSLPAVGAAGLKNIMGVLGTRVVPVPSLYLSGLGNMTGHARFTVPLRDMLEEALLMVEREELQVVL